MIDRAALAQAFGDAGYVADAELATAVAMMRLLQRPLLLEGEAGVGKTEVAKALAAVEATQLIRLQCYEGLDAQASLYEWNYQRQLLAIELMKGEQATLAEKERHVFDRSFLLERPLLRAITQDRAAGAADRRDRPRRRGVRGLPAGAPGRLAGQRARARHHRGHQHPLGGADQQRHARAVRRAAPALPLPLCRLSGRGQGDAHPDHAAAGDRGGAGRRRSPASSRRSGART